MGATTHFLGYLLNFLVVHVKPVGVFFSLIEVNGFVYQDVVGRGGEHLEVDQVTWGLMFVFMKMLST